MRVFKDLSERYTRLHDGRKPRLRAVIQGENRDSPLENPHRKKKILEVANSQLQV
ncbi:MAG: hypothetical protein V4700_01950 [Pseudomonadota bacterium]